MTPTPEATMPPLSTQQRTVLLFIVRRVRDEHRAPPSLREIADAIGARQHRSARLHVNALIRKGYLARAYGEARGLTVLREPGA